MEGGVLFIDNGGYALKAMYLPSGAGGRPRYLTIPNAVGAASQSLRGLVGDAIARLPHYHCFLTRRPVEGGFVVDARLQAYVWEHALARLGVGAGAEVDLYLTVPFAAPKAAAQVLLQLLTEHTRFRSVTFVSASLLTLLSFECPSASTDTTTPSTDHSTGKSRKRTRQQATEEMSAESAALPGCGIVVDVGFSGVSAVPYLHYLPVCSSIARSDVGGKLLANYLRELVSYRQVDVTRDGWLMEHVLQRCGAVALRPRDALDWWSRHRRLRRPSAAAATATELPLPQSEEDDDSLDGSEAAEEEEEEKTSQTDAADRERKSRRLHTTNTEEKTDLSAAAPTSPAAADTATMTPDTTKEVVYYLPSVLSLLPLGCTEEELPARLSAAERADPAFARGLQTVVLRHERLMVPELLFTPLGAGIHQLGVGQCVTGGVFARGLLRELPLLRATLLQRVRVAGGLRHLPGFDARLALELRAETPADDGGGAATAAGGLSLTPAPALQGGDGADAMSAASHQPVRGALLLLTAPRYRRLLELLHSRCRVGLQGSGLLSVETVQDALAALL